MIAKLSTPEWIPREKIVNKLDDRNPMIDISMRIQLYGKTVQLIHETFPYLSNDRKDTFDVENK